MVRDLYRQPQASYSKIHMFLAIVLFSLAEHWLPPIPFLVDSEIFLQLQLLISISRTKEKANKYLLKTSFVPFYM